MSGTEPAARLAASLCDLGEAGKGSPLAGSGSVRGLGRGDGDPGVPGCRVLNGPGGGEGRSARAPYSRAVSGSPADVGAGEEAGADRPADASCGTPAPAVLVPGSAAVVVVAGALAGSIAPGSGTSAPVESATASLRTSPAVDVEREVPDSALASRPPVPAVAPAAVSSPAGRAAPGEPSAAGSSAVSGGPPVAGENLGPALAPLRPATVPEPAGAGAGEAAGAGAAVPAGGVAAGVAGIVFVVARGGASSAAALPAWAPISASAIASVHRHRYLGEPRSTPRAGA